MVAQELRDRQAAELLEQDLVGEPGCWVRSPPSVRVRGVDLVRTGQHLLEAAGRRPVDIGGRVGAPLFEEFPPRSPALLSCGRDRHHERFVVAGRPRDHGVDHVEVAVDVELIHGAELRVEALRRVGVVRHRLKGRAGVLALDDLLAGRVEHAREQAIGPHHPTRVAVDLAGLLQGGGDGLDLGALYGFAGHDVEPESGRRRALDVPAGDADDGLVVEALAVAVEGREDRQDDVVPVPGFELETLSCSGAVGNDDVLAAELPQVLGSPQTLEIVVAARIGARHRRR